MARISGHDEAPTLAEFIRSERDAVLREWEARVRQLSPASKLLSHVELRDHLPQVLDRLAELAEHVGREGTLPVAELEQHALDRLAGGYDLPDMVREYSLLREILLDRASEAKVPGIDSLRVINRVIDHATHVSVSRFSQTSQRMLKALDRISSQAIAAQSNVGELLDRLLRVMLETSPTVDAATILLREGERLRVIAASGLTGERDAEFSLAIGEGLSGTIAKECKPRLVRNASEDPLIKSDFLRRSGIRAMYGVPLVDGDVIGVAHIASRTAYEFSDEEQLLFRATANRATAFIVEARLREDIERRVAELEAVLESIPDGVYVGDASGLRHVNRRGCEVLGIGRDDMLDGSIDAVARRIRVRSVATGEPLPLEAQPYARALDGETVDMEVMIQRVDDKRDRYLRSVAAPIRLHGNIVGAVAINSDITERKQIEEQLKREAEYRERSVGILGHDLRTPMSAIVMAANLLLRNEELPDRASRIVRRILASTARVEAMIRDLLDFTRARSAGGFSLEAAHVELAACARQAVDEVSLAHPERELDFASAGDTWGFWDPHRLAQLVSNLTSNAAQYGAADTPVVVRVRGGTEDVVLEVTNQGPPIPEELRARIFDPFRRGDSSEARRSHGLGLGLFISKSIVSAHGGTIGVTSSAAGTTFTVRLPRRRSHAPS